MDDIKVYYPETIDELPFPNQEAAVPTASSGLASGGEKPVTTQKAPARKFPQRLIAHETIGQALNTRSLNILKEFELTEAGGFRIGKFQDGVSGDIRLTPNGIVARDELGVTKFALDGETGNAIFAGEIQGGSININNQFEVDDDGNVIARSLGFIDTATAAVTGGSQTFTVVGSSVAFSGALLSIDVLRPSYILLLAQFSGYCYRVSGIGDWSASFFGGWSVNGGSSPSGIVTKHEQVGGDDVGDGLGEYHFFHHLAPLNEGHYDLKVFGQLQASTGNGAYQLNDFKITAIDLGTNIA